MYGKGIAKGLWVTFTHFVNTYVDDIRYAGRKYFRQDNFEQRQGLDAFGAFTVQYPTRNWPYLSVSASSHF
jgi:hypothetical protein